MKQDTNTEPAARRSPCGRPELLAPAGGPDAGYAALHFGADAIYLGLTRFSARADAENFTLDTLSAITAYAHACQPPRRVYVTMNTLIRETELAETLETIDALAELRVDALIVQDLGLARLVRAGFPGLRLHASTQQGLHNAEGAQAARQMGFSRVTLARELTLEEISRVVQTGGLEVEVFIHGALCYSYSGRCLFSSMLLGRSGNRGRCAYPCRARYEENPRTTAGELVFSMKDLALTAELPHIVAAGVHALKIEGRKKSPLYVAMATRLYRRLLDGPVTPEELRAMEDDLRMVFSRPWTNLFIRSPANPAVIERQHAGHRGCLIGRIESVRRTRGGDRLRFRTDRPLELHDGLQIDLANADRPYGFAVTDMRPALTPGAKRLVKAQAGSLIEVLLPNDHPALPKGAPVCCASSQAVKSAGHFTRPRPGLHRMRRPLTIELTVEPGRLLLTATFPGNAARSVRRVTTALECQVPPARSEPLRAAAARAVFEQLLSTEWTLDRFTLQNHAGRFVPVSMLKQARRRMLTDLEQASSEYRTARRQALAAALLAVPAAAPSATNTPDWIWSLKTDQPDCLADWQPADWQPLDELILCVDAMELCDLEQALDRWSSRLGPARLRLALPPIVRDWERRKLLDKLRRLIRAGWRKWELSDPGGRMMLEAAGAGKANNAALDMAADWPLYTLNSAAASHWRAWGLARITLSPEDDADNWRELVPRLTLPATAVVYQDTPLMIAETCITRRPDCKAGTGCRRAPVELKSEYGNRLLVCRRGCRNIVINRQPLDIWSRRTELAEMGLRRVRADFMWRDHDPAETLLTWRRLCHGTPGQQRAANGNRRA